MLFVDFVILVIGVENYDDLCFKDIGYNICEIGEFIVNIVDYVNLYLMNVMVVVFLFGVDEVMWVGLIIMFGIYVVVFCIVEVFVVMECCRYVILLVSVLCEIVLGEVVVMYVWFLIVNEWLYIDLVGLDVLGCMGGYGYCWLY